MDWARIFSRRREGEEPPEDSRSSAWASRSTPMRPTRFRTLWRRLGRGCFRPMRSARAARFGG